MKILHIVQNYYPSKGGTQILFKEISERLVKIYGDEVIICTTNSYFGPEKKSFKAIALADEVVNGVTVKRFPIFRYHLPVFRFLNKLCILLKIDTNDFFSRYINGPLSTTMQKFIDDFDGDVICASSCNYLYMNYPLSKKAVKPFVFMGAIHFSEEVQYNPLLSGVLNAIKKSSFYIANTAFEKARLIGYGVKDDVIKVVGCGVDHKTFTSTLSVVDFKRKYKIGEGNVVGYVGRHVPSKGLVLLIDAMEILWKKGEILQLIIAGSSSDYTKVLQKHKEKLGPYSSNVILISNFSDNEKVDIYNHIDVFVSVSTEESFGIVYLEAWACKKPVIGANIGAVRSVIDNNINGFLIDPANANELALKIEELCNDPIKSWEMGLNGYNKVVQNYNWEIITKKYRNIYEQALYGTDNASKEALLVKDICFINDQQNDMKG